ncbi:unnamed protein product [Ectocarpus sp. 12 AP-2014]
MFSSASSTYNLKRPARCIAALAPEEESPEEEQQGGISSSRFVVGTCSLREPNELHVLGFHEESNELLCHQALSHPDEIWGVSPSPTDPSLLVTCSNGAKAGQSNGGVGFKVSLWRLPTPDPNDDPLHEHVMGGERGHPLEPIGEPLAELGGLKAAATAMLWSPPGGGSTSSRGGAGEFVTLADGLLKRWNLGDGRFEEAGSATVCEGGQGGGATTAGRGAPAAAWDPHRPVEVATAASCSVTCWDLRTMKATTSVAEAHRFAVRDLDYNPNKPFCLATCGEDRLIKFWDLRRPNAPVKTIVGHDHWVNTVKYNRFHDQLLVSGSSDCMVHLWRVSSVSSAPLLEPEDDDAGGLDGDAGGDGGGGFGGGGNGSKGEAADIRVRTFDEHEESVYSLAWSASDAWVMASLSYDGLVVLNHVPSTEKYKILL